MNWKAIRLELGRTREFPNGSASRAYLLRLPLDDDGAIDEEAFRLLPEHATVRRLWPSEPDMAGHLVRDGDRWVFVCGRGDKDRLTVCEFTARPISVGAMLELQERNGRKLPFRVAKLSELS